MAINNTGHCTEKAVTLCAPTPTPLTQAQKTPPGSDLRTAIDETSEIRIGARFPPLT